MSNEQHNTIDTVNETGQLNKLDFGSFLLLKLRYSVHYLQHS